jgi:hypothetical protein
LAEFSLDKAVLQDVLPKWFRGPRFWSKWRSYA